MVELKIDLTNRMLCVSGTLAEVEALASRFWPELKKEPVASEPLEPTPSSTASRAKAERSRRRNRPGTEVMNAKDEAINANAIANAIKSRSDFDVINDKILMVPGQWPDKCRLVAWVAECPITSGDVRRVMDALKIKADLPTLSKALSGNSTDFLTSGSNPVRYELTARAKAQFEQLLSR